MKDERKHDRMESLVGRLAAQYLAREPIGDALITITQVKLSEDKANATIFFTAYPEIKEVECLKSAKGRVAELRSFIDEHARIGRIPFLSFQIDRGEKNRQRIDEISEQQ